MGCQHVGRPSHELYVGNCEAVRGIIKTIFLVFWGSGFSVAREDSEVGSPFQRGQHGEANKPNRMNLDPL